MPELFEPQAPSPDQFLGITKKFREVFGQYDHILTSEPVTQIIEPGVAWVVEGQHGPTLVSKNMLILDVDYKGTLSELNSRSDRDHLNDLIERLDEHCLDSISGRGYRTCKGLRFIPTQRVSDQTFLEGLKRFSEALDVDVRYRLATQIRKASQARLKPKRPEMRREILDQDAGHGPRRACRFIGRVNDWGQLPCPSLAAQIRFHDEQTEAFNGAKELF